MRQHKLDIRVIRIFNTYGPYMDPLDGRVVSNFVMQALRGEKLTLYGDGSQTRSFCFVDDLIDGIVRMLASEDVVTGPINLGNPAEFTLLELIKKIEVVMGAQLQVECKSLPADDPRQRCPDIAKARALLSWEPAASLHDGLVKTIEYFRQVINGQQVYKTRNKIAPTLNINDA
jgi:UDP-glucuronate decarboxylase